MPARPKIDRPVYLHTALPESLHARLTLHLYSDLEGRVPKSAYQTFLSERIREYFESERLDTGHGVVSGARETIEALRRRLETQMV